jgi:Tol biopolymer transport system component
MTIVPRIAALVVSLVICVARLAAAQTTLLPLPGPNHSLGGNGRFVVYETPASGGVVAGVWIYDRHTGQHERIDVSSAGTPSNFNSQCTSASVTGRFVVFLSSGTNLVTGDTNNVYDVFVRDRQTGQTTRESFHENGTQITANVSGHCPTIGSDGRYVAFGTAESLAAADTNNGNDIYVRDRTLATTAIVSVSSAGQAGIQEGGWEGRISANGRFVAFFTNEANVLVPGSPGPSGAVSQVLVRDLQTSQTTLVSRSTAGMHGNGRSDNPAISGDGQYVAFRSQAPDLVASDSVDVDVFVHDRDTGETTMVSVSSAGVHANGGSANCCIPISLSADGRYVAFTSVATNLVPLDTNGAEDIFVRDRTLQTTVRASLKGDQSEAMLCAGGSDFARDPVLSDSGIDVVLMTSLPLVGGCPSTNKKYVRRVWPASAGDFDLDRRADVSVFRPGNSTWIARFSATETGAAWQWGAAGDIPTAADFDGDGRTDYAVFRPSTGVWYWLHSWANGLSYGQFHWGAPGDVPAPGDYDGDGKADPTVFRPSTGTWFAKLSGANFATNLILQFGANGDVPVAADYDGDRKTDLAVFRPSSGVWFIRHSSTGAVVIRQWGSNGDITVPGDYDGDERADIAVYRPSQGVWFIAKSTTDFVTYDAIQWGVGADVPVPGDYNGDGRMDPAVFRPGSPATWWIYNQFAMFWGTAGDVPIGGRY